MTTWFPTRRVSVMVLTVIMLHVYWAVGLMIDPSAVHVNVIDALFRYIHPVPVLISVLLAASTLATVGLFTRTPIVLLCFIPQQLLLMMSASGSIQSIYLGQFANGGMHPSTYIAMDQGYCWIAAIGHTVAIISHAWRITK